MVIVATMGTWLLFGFILLFNEHRRVELRDLCSVADRI
jgi:hypothetical protein